VDLQMPGIGAVEAIRRVGALLGPRPVLVPTVYDTDAEMLPAGVPRLVGRAAS
jgi:DNA-binding NarL/FixJ family response regulator